jgi:hypothetical protein
MFVNYGASQFTNLLSLNEFIIRIINQTTAKCSQDVALNKMGKAPETQEMK